MAYIREGPGSVLENVLESRITSVWQEEFRMMFHIFNCKTAHKYMWHFNSIQ